MGFIGEVSVNTCSGKARRLWAGTLRGLVFLFKIALAAVQRSGQEGLEEKQESQLGS